MTDTADLRAGRGGRNAVGMVVFDLGGVLLRIHHDFQGAAKQARLETLPGEPPLGITAFENFNRYQAGQLGLRPYLISLAERLGVTEEQALEIHRSIPIGPYPGADELLADLRTAGIRTGCLSNTNAVHWEMFCSPDLFPGIASIEAKMPSHEVRMHKPDPRLFRLFEVVHQVSTGEVVYFDDVEDNVSCAAEYGWRAYRVNRDDDPPSQVRTALADEGLILG